MSTLVVHVDGLLVNDTDNPFNQDVLVHGVEFVHKLYDGWQGTTLFMAQGGGVSVIRPWLSQIGFKPTWVEVFENMNAMQRMAAILSAAGDRMSPISMFITNHVYDATIMAGEGITSLHFIHPARVKNWGPEPGTAWEKRMAELGSNDGDG